MKTILSLFLIFSVVNSSIAQDTWLQLANFDGVDREAATVFTINGKAYAGLGFDEDGIELADFKVYDPVMDNWEDIASFPGTPRLYASAFTIGDYGYVIGGFQTSGYIYDVWEYNSINDLWSQKADYPGTGSLRPGVFAIDGKGYVVGGQSENGLTKETWEFDPIANSWEQKTDFPGAPRCKMMNFAINNIGYIGLGGPTFNMFGTFEKDLYAYNPQDDTWTQKAESPFVGIGLVSTFVIEDIAYAITGSTFDLFYSDLVFAYDPALDIWIQKNFFEGFDRHHASGFSIGDKGYLIFGHSGETGFMKEVWEYSPNMATPVINVKEDVSSFSIFPNPTIGTVNFTSTFKPSKVSIYNSLGKLQQNLILNEHQSSFNLNDFSAGIYYLYFSLNDKVEIKKLIIL